MRKLNLGCGDKVFGGWINIDNRHNVKFTRTTNSETDQVYIQRDILRGLPFDDSTVDEVLCDNLLEHIPPGEDVVFLMNEIWRVMKPGAILHIKVPEAGKPVDFQDPTHKSHWNMNTIDYFLEKPANAGRRRAGLSYGIKATFELVKPEERNAAGGLFVWLRCIKN
jgi:predicted SAM-dependent methyltransferase